MKVSIIIPVVRPEKAKRCVASILEHDLGPDHACRLKTQGNTTEGDYNFLFLVPALGREIEIIVRKDTEAIGCPRMVAKLTQMARGEHILFLGDDTIPQPGFLNAALEKMASLPDGWGLVALNDGIHNGALATHWLASKRLLDHLPDGQFFNTAYRHCFCDRELTDIARELGRYAYAENAKIIHDHPHVTGQPYDEGYKKAYAVDAFMADQRTYRARKIARNAEAHGVKLAIAIPLVDREVPSNFMVSLLMMDKPDFELLLPRFPAGRFHESLASVRNDLVEQALEEGCTHLLMMDTDQIYEPDTISRLLSHGKPVVGAAVHRRWPPFDLVMLRGELGAYSHVPEVECYSGKLVPVDATGTGCLLFDTRVFLEIPAPWFQFGHHNGQPVGEDIMLCSKLRAAGVPIHVDTSLEVTHLTTLQVNRNVREFYKRFHGHEFAPAK